jgi:hypothetical protein
MITAQDKLACVQRELAMRRKLYPRWVAEEKMTQQKSDREIAIMEAIVKDCEANVELERLL